MEFKPKALRVPIRKDGRGRMKRLLAAVVGAATVGPQQAVALRVTLRLKAVADTGFSQQMAGLSRVALQFLPQATDIDTHVVFLFHMRGAPDLPHQVSVRQHFAGTGQQHGKQASAADRNDNRLNIRTLFQYLEANSSLSGNHCRIIIGVDKRRASFFLYPHCLCKSAAF